MMKFPRSAAAVLIASGALLLSATGGAVAAHLITSSDIQDETIRSVDVKNGTLKTGDISAAARAALQGNTGPAGPQGSPGISGYQILQASKPVAANTPTDIVLLCPVGKKVISGSGHWSTSNVAVQFILKGDGTGGTSFTSGIPTADTLFVRIICGVVQ